jgi:hypothetical protein
VRAVIGALLTRLANDPRRRQRLIRVAQFRSRYAFRVRFELANRQALSFETAEVVLGEAEDVRLVALQGQSINETDKVGIIGRGYRSEAAADDAANRWRGYVERGFARVDVGADFNPRGGVATEHGLANFATLFPGMPRVEPWRPLLNDFPRMVFRQRPWPKLVRVGLGDLTVSRNPRTVIGSIQGAASMDIHMPERQALAYNLFSASFSAPSEDARFVMLMMALETMLEPAARSEAANQHVDKLIAVTQSSELPDAQSMVAVLESLRDESIGQAGRRLSRTLGSRRYADEKPADFFTACYEIRSGLVHGQFPRPSVDGRVAALETFVSNLLSAELLDAVDIAAIAASSPQA